MATTVTLRQILDRKQWEMCSAVPFGVGFNAPLAVCQSTLPDQFMYWNQTGSNSFGFYDPRQDSFQNVPPVAGFSTWNAVPTSLTFHPSGPTGTATAGASTTITTALTLSGGLAGYTIRITGGTGAGQERVIASNTPGTNSVISVTSAWTTTPDNTSTFLLLTGRAYLFSGYSSLNFRYYDLATNTWSSALTTTGLPAAANSAWAIAATPAYGNTTATGTATAGGSATLTNSAKAWATNQWANYQVRITAGTGAGQVRTVASNTATALTVGSAWATTPDATSAYALEPNDDFIYLVAQTSGTSLYRYSISGNAWTTLTASPARTSGLGQGGTLQWIGNTSEPTWADEANIRNGRFLVSIAGSGSAALAHYDIATNGWTVNASAPGRSSGSSDFTGGYGTWSMTTDREYVYILTTSQGNSALTPSFRYNAVTQNLEPFSVFPINTNSGAPGQRAGVVTYNDGGTTLRWIYWLPNCGGSIVTMYRILVI